MLLPTALLSLHGCCCERESFQSCVCLPQKPRLPTYLVQRDHKAERPQSRAIQLKLSAVRFNFLLRDLISCCTTLSLFATTLSISTRLAILIQSSSTYRGAFFLPTSHQFWYPQSLSLATIDPNSKKPDPDSTDENIPISHDRLYEIDQLRARNIGKYLPLPQLV